MISRKCMKRIMILAIAIFLLATMGVVFASDDNYGYSFSLKANHVNSYSGARYRQTSNENNKWKVQMTYNSEGKGCKATFWLAKDDSKRTVASNTYTIKQGAWPNYAKATAVASRSNVRLGAENNNNTACSVAGYWDEETN